jgi:beta-lactamase class A
MAADWAALDDKLDNDRGGRVGTVSVYVGRPGAPATYTRQAAVGHPAASTMKVGILVAAYRAADRGALSLDAPVEVVNDFPSALGDGSRYSDDRDYDDEAQVWTRLGRRVPLRWLMRRMIVGSSNLATNVVLQQVGLPAVAAVWRSCGARTSVTRRGIEDYAARDAGLDNVVTVGDLAALFSAIELRTAASASACAEMLDILAAQEHRVDLANGVPDGVRVAHKNGWIPGARHSAGLVYPADAPPYVVSVCTSAGRDPGEHDDAEACALIARVSRVAYDLRQQREPAHQRTQPTDVTG